MTRLVGQHLALLLLEQGRALDLGLPPDPERTRLVEAAFGGAIAQERQLALRTTSSQVHKSQLPEIGATRSVQGACNEVLCAAAFGMLTTCEML